MPSRISFSFMREKPMMMPGREGVDKKQCEMPEMPTPCDGCVGYKGLFGDGAGGP